MFGLERFISLATGALQLHEAISSPIFRVTAAFFADVFQVVCVTSKLFQSKSGVRIDAVRGAVNVLSSQLLHMTDHIVPGGWEEGLGVELAISPVRGSRASFLQALASDLQRRFAPGDWVQEDGVPDWVEASSCCCERVFSFDTQTDGGQPTGSGILV